MPILPYVFVTREAIDAEVKRFIASLGPEVVRVNYKVGEDSVGDPAIHFWIVLDDAAVKRDSMSNVAGSVRKAIDEQLDPLSKWGLFAFPTFRVASSSKRARYEPEWA